MIITLAILFAISCVLLIIFIIRTMFALSNFEENLTKLENEKYQNCRMISDIKEDLNSLKEDVNFNNEILIKFLVFAASRDLELIKQLPNSTADKIIRDVNIFENNNINRFLLFITNDQYLPALKSKLLEKINPSYCSCNCNYDEKIECSFETAVSLYYYGVCTNSVVDRSRILNILKRTKFSQFKTINTFSSEIYKSLKDNKEIN